MALPLLSYEQVAQQLWRRKCQLVKDCGHHALWKTTKIKHHFTVPQEGPDKQCSAYVFEEILKEIDTLQGRQSEVRTPVRWALIEEATR